SLLVADQWQPKDGFPLYQCVTQHLQVEPQVIGVEVRVAMLISKEMHLLFWSLSGVPQYQLPIALPPG
ncbi:hypothetical protein QP226_10340, partial [Aerococcus urinae]